MGSGVKIPRVCLCALGWGRVGYEVTGIPEDGLQIGAQGLISGLEIQASLGFEFGVPADFGVGT